MKVLNETINELKAENEYNKSIGCNVSLEEQIVLWLEELEEYREIGTVDGYRNAIECYTEEYILRKSNEQYNYKRGYNKAINDCKTYIELNKKYAEHSTDDYVNYKKMDNWLNNKIAEQSKCCDIEEDEKER